MTVTHAVRRLVSVVFMALCLTPAVPAEVDFPYIVTQTIKDRTGDQVIRFEQARLILVRPHALEILTPDFHSACDPAVSFDGERILFAGKKGANDDFNIFEMTLATREVRQVTREMGSCRSPHYQSTFYTIVSTEPWYQLTFVSRWRGPLSGAAPNEAGAANLFSCTLDGASPRRLTHNPADDRDPFLMWDGRILYSAGRVEGGSRLFGVNVDGADMMIFGQDTGDPVRRMPCATDNGWVIYVESKGDRPDGAGTLAALSERRPLYTYRSLTEAHQGLYHAPTPLAGGDVLVAWRPNAPEADFEMVRFDPETGRQGTLFNDPKYNDVQVAVLLPRAEPDGRSSVVTETDPLGKFYCMNVNINDLKPEQAPPGLFRHLRVIEGVERQDISESAAPRPQRILGEVPICEDGSFNLSVPASVPIKLQIVDDDGLAIRSCDWIWAMNHEPRGCIGCHEDPELTPENRFVQAVSTDSLSLAPPVDKRREVTYVKHIRPLIEAKCVKCHQETNSKAPLLSRSFLSDRLVPGHARLSPVIWNILGKDTTRPWDKAHSDEKTIRQMPPPKAAPLSTSEKRTFIEWIDLGAN